MLTTKTINNQNAVTNAILGLDDNSTTTINGNTTLNTLTVNGVSNFNTGAGFNAGMQIRDNNNGTFAQLFQSGPNLTLNTWTANSRIRLNTAGATAGVTTNNLMAENGNRISIQGQSGQGIDILNDQIAMNGTTTFNNQVNFNNNVNLSTYNFDITNSAKNQGLRIFNNGTNNALTQFVGLGNNTRFNFNTTSSTGTSVNNFYISGSNTCVLQGQAGQGIQMVDDQIAINGVTTFNNSINGNNNTITLTDGTITNTLDESNWTGTIKTVNTTANATHYLNFSDSSSTGQGNPQKHSFLNCNPSTGKISATSFNGNLIGTASNANNIALVSDNTNGTYYIPFSKTLGSSNVLYVNDSTTPLYYNPSNLYSTTFTGSFVGASTTAKNLEITSDNTAGTYFIPFIKTTANSSTALFVDDVTGPLFYNPSLSTLSCGIFNGDLQFSSTTNSSSFSSGILTISCATFSIRNFNFVFTGTTNIISGLTTTGPRTNGVYLVALQNNGSGNLTINNTGLGANIKTTYSSAITVPASGSALMTINVITLNSIQTTIVEFVDVKILT